MSAPDGFQAYPPIAEYDLALQHPGEFLLTEDPELLGGAVDTVRRSTILGEQEVPYAVSGAFAVVYRFRTAAGRPKALRLFTAPLTADMAERYDVLAPYLRERASEITAGFAYFTEGISIQQQDGADRALPMIVMDWVEGVPLAQAVDRLCREDDRAGLAQLYATWLALLRCLAAAGIAHGDLASGNVLVTAEGRLVLVDYDGCFIPPLRGRAATVNGQPDYQHPRLKQRAFDARIDDFSVLVISTALLAAAAEPALWRRLATHDSDGALTGDHMLFTRRDLSDPAASPIFAALAGCPDPRVARLLAALRCACVDEPGATPRPLPLLDPAWGDEEPSGGEGPTVAAADPGLVDTLLRQGQLEAGLRLARELGLVRGDAPYRTALRRFLTQQELSGLTARLHGRLLEATWSWPPSDLVDMATVVCSTSGWPAGPRDPRATTTWLSRADYQRAGGFVAPVGPIGMLYVRVFGAMSGAADDEASRQCSAGLAPSTRAVARRVCKVRCQVRRRPWSSKRILDLWTEDGQPLPALVVVRSAGPLPLAAEEGTPVRYVDGQAGNARARLELDVGDWPRGSVLRVFPRDGDDEAWVRVAGRQGVRLAVN